MADEPIETIEDAFAFARIGAAAPLLLQSISQAIAYHEYEDFPRGRIVYEIKTGRFIDYVIDGCNKGL
jgi:hypothetical protein